MSSDRIYSALRWKAITPSDTDKLEPIPAAISVNVAGNIAIEGDDGNSEIITVVAGIQLGIQPHRILATGTTATGIIAYYN